MTGATILRAYLTGYYGPTPLSQLPDEILEAAANRAREHVRIAGYGAAWEPVAASILYRLAERSAA